MFLAIMSNHLHLIVQQGDGKLSDWVRNFKKFTSKSFPMAIGVYLEGFFLMIIFSLPTAQESQLRKDFAFYSCSVYY